MRKKFKPILRFFRRLAEAAKSACQSGLFQRAGASVSGAKIRTIRFFAGLWKNWSSVRKSGLFRRLAAYIRRKKERAFQLIRDRLFGKDPAFRSALLKQGSVLALMVLVTVCSVKTVMASTHIATITCDGVASQVEMASTETDQILSKAGIQTATNDLVTRSDDPDHIGDVAITVRTAREVAVEADGTSKTVTAHYGDTVSDVLEEAGVSLDSDDLVTPAESKTVDDGTEIQVTRMYQITVAVDGSKKDATVKEGSVSDAVKQAGVQVGSEDTMNVSPDEAVDQGMEIAISRVTYKEVTETREISYQTVTKADSSLFAGTEKVKTAGQNGSEQVVVRQKLVNGQVTETQDISTTVITEPVNQVTLVGTKRTAVRSIGSNGTLVDASGKTITYKKVLTGRCSCYTGGGYTSTGAKAAFGRVAVNPNIIPYGTKLYICSPDGSLVYGYAIAADTGGAAMNGKIVADLYYDSYSQCIKIGTRTMNVYVL